jgi:hypothetical protein
MNKQTIFLIEGWGHFIGFFSALQDKKGHHHRQRNNEPFLVLSI